jgi:RNA polymerase sigma-70 factor, ECF subfamily
LIYKPFAKLSEFEAIFKEYFVPLVNFVNTFLHNHEDSKEVVQNSFLNIWRNKDRIEIKISLKSYLYQTTKNNMIDFIRKNKALKNISEINNDVIENLADQDHEMLDPYLVRNAIELVLKNLKPKSREIFELNKFEGLTYEEIAQYLNISKRAVEDNIAKVTQSLKSELKNHPYFFD